MSPPAVTVTIKPGRSGPLGLAAGGGGAGAAGGVLGVVLAGSLMVSPVAVLGRRVRPRDRDDQAGQEIRCWGGLCRR